MLLQTKLTLCQKNVQETTIHTPRLGKLMKKRLGYLQILPNPSVNQVWTSDTSL